MIRRYLAAALAPLLLLSLLLSLASCGKSYERSEEITDLVCISVEGYGNIIVKLDPTSAPITVANFKKLVSEGFYTGSDFHRIIDDFMIQGGRSAIGASAARIEGEFELNGHDNPIKHKRGVISMARANAFNSASSEFFIVQTKHADWLDGKYAAFGRVVSGMKIVDRIAGVSTNFSDMPFDPVIIREIYFVRQK